jgi:hypothetical protein
LRHNIEREGDEAFVGDDWSESVNDTNAKVASLNRKAAFGRPFRMFACQQSMSTPSTSKKIFIHRPAGFDGVGNLVVKWIARSNVPRRDPAAVPRRSSSSTISMAENRFSEP